MLKSVNAPTFG